MRTLRVLVAALLLSFGLSSCVTMSNKDMGNILGGVGGAVIGNQLGGNVGLVVGAITGYVIGGAIGREMDRTDHERAARELDAELRSTQMNGFYESPGRVHRRGRWQNGGRDYEVYTTSYATSDPHCRRYVQQVIMVNRGYRKQSVHEGVTCWHPYRGWEIR